MPGERRSVTRDIPRLTAGRGRNDVQPNAGRCPPEARGKRVKVRLASGHTFDAPADGRGEPNWSLALGKSAIESWEIV